MTCFDTKVKIQNKRRKILLTLQLLFPFWDYGRKWFGLQDSIRELSKSQLCPLLFKWKYILCFDYCWNILDRNISFGMIWCWNCSKENFVCFYMKISFLLRLLLVYFGQKHFILHDFIKELFKNKVLLGKEIMNEEFVPKGNNALHSPSVISSFIESLLSTWNQHCWQKLCTHKFYLGPSNFDAVSLSFSICREAANAETEWDSVKGIQQVDFNTSKLTKEFLFGVCQKRNVFLDVWDNGSKDVTEFERYITSKDDKTCLKYFKMKLNRTSYWKCENCIWLWVTDVTISY